MKFIQSCLALSLLSPLSLGCGPHHRPILDMGQHHDIEPTEIPLSEDCFDEEGAPIQIDGARLRDNQLTLDFSHPSGCGTPTYRVCASNAILQSDPPQRNFHLLHIQEEVPGETCDGESHQGSVVVDVGSAYRGLSGLYERTVRLTY